METCISSGVYFITVHPVVASTFISPVFCYWHFNIATDSYGYLTHMLSKIGFFGTKTPDASGFNLIKPPIGSVTRHKVLVQHQKPFRPSHGWKPLKFRRKLSKPLADYKAKARTERAGSSSRKRDHVLDRGRRLPSQHIHLQQAVLGSLDHLSILAPPQRTPLLQEEVAFVDNISRMCWKTSLDSKFVSS